MLQLGSFFAFSMAWILLPQIAVTANFVSPSESCNFDQTGTSPVGFQVLGLEDPARSGSFSDSSVPRSIPVTIWYPAIDNGETEGLIQNIPQAGTLANAQVAPVPTGSGSHPLLIFSHGGFGQRTGSASLLQHLASWGFVVAAPSHAGDSTDPNVPLAVPYDFSDRPLDIKFVVDELLDSNTFLINPTNGEDPIVGVLGDSVGGSTAAVAPKEDPRILARMTISPTSTRLNNDPAELEGIDTPLLVVGGQDDTFVPIADNNTFFFDNSVEATPRWNFVFRDAGHTSFSDLCIFFQIVQATLCSGQSINCVYAAFGGPRGPAEGERRINEGICDVTLPTTLPLLRYSAVSFFRAMLLDGKKAKKAERCLKKLKKAGDPEYLVKYKFKKSEKSGKSSKSSSKKSSKS